MQVFAKTVGLEGLLSLLKTESERYTEQNGRMFQTMLEELCAFLGINILMGIRKLPKMRDHWCVDEGLGNTLIQKTMTRDRFLEILQNLHLRITSRSFHLKKVKILIVLGNSDPFLITY